MAFLLNSKSVAMIPAAGFGTRLGAITAHTPKPLVEVQGITMLERACAHLHEAGFRRIAINTHYLSEQIHAFIPKLQQRFQDTNFHISHEPDILDIGGGMKKVACDLRLTEMLIFNADSLLYGTLRPLASILSTWDPRKMEALLYLKGKGNASEADFNLSPDSKLVRLEDKRDHGYFYTGISIYRTEPFCSIQESKFHIMKDYVFPKMLVEHNFYGTLLESEYIDIGTPKTLEAVGRKCLKE